MYKNLKEKENLWVKVMKINKNLAAVSDHPAAPLKDPNLVAMKTETS